MTKNKRTKHIFLGLAALACSATVLGVIAANNVKTNIFRASDVDSEYTVTFSYDSLTAEEKAEIADGTGSIVRTLPGGSGIEVEMKISGGSVSGTENIAKLTGTSQKIDFIFRDNGSGVKRFKKIKGFDFIFGENNDYFKVNVSAINGKFNNADEFATLSFTNGYYNVPHYDFTSAYQYCRYVQFTGYLARTNDFKSISINYSCGATESNDVYKDLLLSKASFTPKAATEGNSISVSFNNDGTGSAVSTSYNGSYQKNTTFNYTVDCDGNLSVSNLSTTGSIYVRYGFDNFESGKVKMSPKGELYYVEITTYNSDYSAGFTYQCK